MFVKDFKLSLRIENLTERARIDNLTKKKNTLDFKPGVQIAFLLDFFVFKFEL